MIAQIVFDLPLDGPFDYLVPDALASKAAVGWRAKVSFGRKIQTGFVVGLIAQSSLPQLKPILSLPDSAAAFNNLDLEFAGNFSAYYGCSLGQALGTMLRHQKVPVPSVSRAHKPQNFFYRCHPDAYADKIREILQSRARPAESHFLILVPDIFHSQALASRLNGLPVQIGTRSSVFESDGRFDGVIMVDQEDPSYKQEQMPMYDTTQVLLERSRLYGFDVCFLGISPSVEIMAMAREGEIQLVDEGSSWLAAFKLVDLTNYKSVPGLVSPPVRDALEASLKAGHKSLFLLNRRGSYRMTRCTDCGAILNCHRCDSPLYFSRSEGKFLCRHCTFSVPGDTVCPACRKPSWRSYGIGVEQLQAELKKIFSKARIAFFERPARAAAKSAAAKPSLTEFDILIATQAVLRFQGQWKAQTLAFIDFDSQLNRLDMRSAFQAYSLALHISAMASGPVWIQTRNSHHYVLQSLAHGRPQEFYDEELKLRKELGFSPFKHWVKITWRGKTEKSARAQAQEMYNQLNHASGEGMVLTPPQAEAVSKKRGQYRFHVMVQAKSVPEAMTFIKSAMRQTKRQSRVIVTFEIDP